MTDGAAAQATRWPDFYLVGAPKAGTTSLYAYLSEHPSVFLPERKELRFFGADLEVRNRRRFSQAEFLREYAAARDEQLRGNAYVWYLFSRLAAEEIRALRPDARIIVMLRNPVDALFSLHSEFVYDGNEDLAEFAEALAAEADRCAGRRIPAEAHFPAGLCYRSTVRYAEQLERYLAAFGREQVHIILFDDFARTPGEVYDGVVRFLGLPGHRPDRFERLNPNKRSRSALLRRALASPPASVRAAARRVVPPGIRRRVYRRVVELNTRMGARAEMPAELRRRLQAELEDGVVALERLLDVRLGDWLDSP